MYPCLCIVIIIKAHNNEKIIIILYLYQLHVDGVVWQLSNNKLILFLLVRHSLSFTFDWIYKNNNNNNINSNDKVDKNGTGGVNVYQLCVGRMNSKV